MSARGVTGAAAQGNAGFLDGDWGQEFATEGDGLLQLDGLRTRNYVPGLAYFFSNDR